MVRICAGRSEGLAALTNAATPATKGVEALVPVACTYQIWLPAAPRLKLKQPMLVPGPGSPKSVPGTPALQAPRMNPVGLHGVPKKAQPPAGTSPPGADRPCRLTPKSLYDARQSVPGVQNGGEKSGFVV